MRMVKKQRYSNAYVAENKWTHEYSTLSNSFIQFFSTFSELFRRVSEQNLKSKK